MTDWTSALSLLSFVIRLSESGRVRVPELVLAEVDFAETEENSSVLGEAIDAADQQRRAELGHEAPRLDRGGAYWGFTRLYRACRIVVSRTIDEADLRVALHTSLPEANAEQHYSVDLALGYWADVVRLAAERSPLDPWIPIAQDFIEAWPLSAVGVTSVTRNPAQIAANHPVLTHPALRQLYTDRIIDRGDAVRANDPSVAPWIAPHLVGAPRSVVARLRADKPRD